MIDKPFKLTVEHYDTKISIERDYSDVNINELHEMWLSMLIAIGFNSETIKEYYKE